MLLQPGANLELDLVDLPTVAQRQRIFEIFRQLSRVTEIAHLAESSRSLFQNLHEAVSATDLFARARLLTALDFQLGHDQILRDSRQRLLRGTNKLITSDGIVAAQDNLDKMVAAIERAAASAAGNPFGDPRRAFLAAFNEAIKLIFKAGQAIA